MAMAVGGRGSIKADINVTPLVDVVLVLLIIFMVVTPMLQRGKSVELPKTARTEKTGEQGKDPIVLSLTAAKEMWLEETRFENAGLLQEGLRQARMQRPDATVLVKGDSRLTVGDVRQAMAAARKAGFKGVNLAIEEKQ